MLSNNDVKTKLPEVKPNNIQEYVIFIVRLMIKITTDTHLRWTMTDDITIYQAFGFLGDKMGHFKRDRGYMSS